MAALKCNPAHLYSVVIFTFSGLLGLQGSIFCLVTETLNPGLGGVRDVTSAIISHEQTQSNRVCYFQTSDSCISKGSPFRLFDSEVLITTGKALITFCVDFFYKVF